MEQDINRVNEIGIMLPNGDMVWNEYRGYNLNTVQGRIDLFEAVRKVAVDLSFELEDFYENYLWVSREVIYFTEKVNTKFSSPKMYTREFEEEPSENNN